MKGICKNCKKFKEVDRESKLCIDCKIGLAEGYIRYI